MKSLNLWQWQKTAHKKECEPIIEKIDLPFSDTPGENQALILANSFKSFKDYSRKVQLDQRVKER